MNHAYIYFRTCDYLKGKKKPEDGSLAAPELIRNSITHRIKL